MIVSHFTHSSWHWHHGKTWRLSGGLECLHAEFLTEWVQMRDLPAEAYARGFKDGVDHAAKSQ